VYSYAEERGIPTVVAKRVTVGWIKMPLGKEVGLGPGHIVLDGDPVGPSPPQQPSHFRPMPIVPNGRPSEQLLSSCGKML